MISPIRFANEKQATTCTAVLMDYKNKHFAAFAGLDSLTLDFDYIRGLL